MPLTMNEILTPGLVNHQSEYPHAPQDWTPSKAKLIASRQGILLSKDHFIALRAIQEYIFVHEDKTANVREIHDALGEKFHSQGGVKYLYQLFPGGPVAQGYLIAGCNPPASAANGSFGSVQ